MKRRCYTLFEMVVVVALIVLLAGLAVPSIESMYGDYKVQSAVDQVRGRWAQIRSRAVKEGRPYRFACTPGTGDFRVEPVGAADDASAPAGDGSQALVAEDSLPQGITFAAVNGPDGAPADSGGGMTTAAVFLPDGTAQQDQEIVFRYAGAQPIALRLRALTGGMSTRRVSPNGLP